MDQVQQKNNRRLIRNLVLGALLMFGFGFLLVPLYDVFCRVTGLNGKVFNTGPVSEAPLIDTGRKIAVQLIAVNNEGMPWRFTPAENELQVYPGEMKQTHYIAFNPTARFMVAQAVPSVAPAEAADYLHKINCFCFEQQPLNSKEQREMPLVLMIDRKLPQHIKTITLSYTIFDVTRQQHAVSEGDGLRRESL